MGIETLIGELISPNNLLILANIILIFIAFLLLIGLRKSRKKPETSVKPDIQPKKEKESELSGIADIKPEEFIAEKFEQKKDVLAAATPPESAPRQGIESFSTAMKALVEPLMKPEDAKVPEAAVEARKVPEKSAFIEPEKYEEPGPEVMEIDEFELEDELPEIFEAPSELEIPLPVKEEDKPAEKPDVSPPEPEVKPPVKEEEIPPEEFTLPLELFSKKPEKVVEKAEEVVEAEPEIPPIVTEMDKLVEAFTAPPELEITKQAVEEVKSEEVVEAPPESDIIKPVVEKEKVPEAPIPPHAPELETFKHEAEEEKAPEAVTAPPEIKLFSFDSKEKKPEVIAAPPEPEIIKPVVEEEKVPEAPIPPPAPELKIFKHEAEEEKKPEAMPATPEILTAEKTEEPATVTEGLSGEPAAPEPKEKKAKRKSLF